MRSPLAVRLLLVLALLLATMVPSAMAGKVKGLKGSSSATSASRNLKDKDDKKKDKIPKNKVKGPQSRSCTSKAKSSKVSIECRSRSGAINKAKGKEGGKKEAKGKGEDAEAETRGINLTPSEEIRDKIKYDVRTSKKGIQVAIEYTQEIESATSENKTETEFEIKFESLVEYVKGAQTQRWGFNNGVSTEAYNWDTDEIIQVIPLSNWERIPGIVTESRAEGVVSYFTASASLTSPEVAIGPTGVSHFNFTVSEADLDEHITANNMKIDVRILDFPWQRSDSYVALMSTVNSKKKVQLEYEDEALVSGGKSKVTEDVYIAFDEEMQSLGVEAFGAYTWDNSAEATTADGSKEGALTERGGSRRAQENTTDNGDAEDGIVEDVLARPAAPPGPPTNVQHVQGSTTTIQVVATSPEDQATDNYQEIAYSFIGDSAHSAAEIYWDPEAGVGYGQAPVSAAWALNRMSWAGSVAGALLYLLF